MGDRGNIVVRATKDSNKDDVWFYTHWSGSEIAETAKRALNKAKARWTDSSYFARSVFQELIGDDTGTTGFGISTTIQDNEHDILVLDTQAQEVFTVKESDLKDGRLPAKLADGTPFETFAK